MPQHRTIDMASLDAYLETILTLHPDALELVKAPEFRRWIETRPVTDYTAIYGDKTGAGGDPMTVIGILNAYKRGRKIWTRKEIAALTDKEFQKLEHEIDEAMAEGRIA